MGTTKHSLHGLNAHPSFHGTAKDTFAEYSQFAKEKVESGLDSAYAQVLSQPKTTFILLAIVSPWLGNIGTNFQEQIVDDVEVFLPEGAESTDLLLEVRESGQQTSLSFTSKHPMQRTQTYSAVIITLLANQYSTRFHG